MFFCIKKSKKDWIWNPTINKLSNFVDVSHPGLIVKRKYIMITFIQPIITT